MSGSNNTKKLLARSFKTLLSEQPFEKTSIGEICDLCDMNRKSFYYHFHDKYELVIWIFNNEFLTPITESESGAEEKLCSLCTYLYDNRQYYKKILPITGQNSFTEYFTEICTAYLTDTAREIPSLRNTDGTALSDIASAFVALVYKWITANDGRDGRCFATDVLRLLPIGCEIRKSAITQSTKGPLNA